MEAHSLLSGRADNTQVVHNHMRISLSRHLQLIEDIGPNYTNTTTLLPLRERVSISYSELLKTLNNPSGYTRSVDVSRQDSLGAYVIHFQYFYRRQTKKYAFSSLLRVKVSLRGMPGSETTQTSGRQFSSCRALNVYAC